MFLHSNLAHLVSTLSKLEEYPLTLIRQLGWLILLHFSKSLRFWESGCKGEFCFFFFAFHLLIFYIEKYIQLTELGYLCCPCIISPALSICLDIQHQVTSWAMVKKLHFYIHCLWLLGVFPFYDGYYVFFTHLKSSVWNDNLFLLVKNFYPASVCLRNTLKII